jgi:hypothetical protein
MVEKVQFRPMPPKSSSREWAVKEIQEEVKKVITSVYLRAKTWNSATAIFRKNTDRSLSITPLRRLPNGEGQPSYHRLQTGFSDLPESHRLPSVGGPPDQIDPSIALSFSRSGHRRPCKESERDHGYQNEFGSDGAGCRGCCKRNRGQFYGGGPGRHPTVEEIVKELKKFVGKNIGYLKLN